MLRARPPRRLFATFEGTGDLVLPGISRASVTLSLIAFNALFALHNALDAAYLSGFAQLPTGITLAEYAHRGAYPLIVTALLAALFVLVTLRPGSSTAAAPLVRRLVTLWIAQNLVLVLWRMLAGKSASWLINANLASAGLLSPSAPTISGTISAGAC